MPSLRNRFDHLLEGAAPKVTRQELTHVERLALVRRHWRFLARLFDRRPGQSFRGCRPSPRLSVL
ncbi:MULTISPECIES: hypothetical protein [unclassified Mesorhizobium]|uniref:hypothetical protein n=1 Tax=unclassified Mesorhizobium TaxID=325217 RepID=UPI0013E00622|nr:MULTISPECIES: hypothetical protein [unclassified Mesorhizobium]